MSIGRGVCGFGVAGSQRAYVKIQKAVKARSCWAEARERRKNAVASTRHLPDRPSAGRYHRFVFFAAVIPSLVEPVRAGSLL